MKKYGTALVLLLAVVSGLVAVAVTHRWLTSQTAEQPLLVKETVPMVEIVVAGVEIPVGAKLTNENLSMVDWPKSSVPKGSFENKEELIERVTATRLMPGQPIYELDLAAPGSGAGLVATIEPGYRAMAIKVDEVVGVGGFVQPDTYVDVISVEGERTSAKSVKTILKRVKVLAIAQETFNEEGKPKVVKTVTLQLKPKEAEKLALKTHEGAIHLSLRNPADEVEVAVAPPPPPEPKPVKKAKWVPTLEPNIHEMAPKPYNVEVIRGSTNKKQTLTFEHAGSEEQL